MITIKIKTDNAAFSDDTYGQEAARILREMANVMEACGREDGGVSRHRDINGSVVATMVQA